MYIGRRCVARRPGAPEFKDRAYARSAVCVPPRLPFPASSFPALPRRSLSGTKAGPGYRFPAAYGRPPSLRLPNPWDLGPIP